MTYHKLICYYREQYIIHIYLGKSVEEVQQSAQILQNWFTNADFEVKEPLGCGSDNERRAELLCTDESEWENTLAIEHDIMYGRGAYLCKQVERELAFQREQAKILRQFEAMRALIDQ